MAIVLMEGFDHFSAAQSVLNGWSPALNAVGTGATFTPFNYGQSGRVVNARYDITLGGPTYSTLYVGFDFYLTAVTSADTHFYMRGSATNVLRMTLIVSGADRFLRFINSAGTTLATGTTTILVNQWYHAAIKCVVNASTGSVELRLNGLTSSEMAASSVNTGSTNIDTLGFETGNSQQMYIDNLYALDTTGSSPTNDWIGAKKIETLAPNGNGANTAWTGVYTDWDDSTSHDTDTTYASSSTPGDRETSTLTDLVSTGTVYAVQTNLVARKDDAGARTIAPVIRIGSTNYDGTTTAGLTSSYANYKQLYDRLDPSGASWTAATVNAMEAGAKEVA
jgi:hypothetical protein